MSAITLVPVASAQSIQLTRRGRAVRSFCLLALSLLVLLGVGRAVAASLASQFQVVPREPVVSGAQVVVVEGDTLWRIARRVVPDRDPRAVVGDIRMMNRLDGSLIYPGQVLTVPNR